MLIEFPIVKRFAILLPNRPLICAHRHAATIDILNAPSERLTSIIFELCTNTARFRFLHTTTRILGRAMGRHYCLFVLVRDLRYYRYGSTVFLSALLPLLLHYIHYLSGSPTVNPLHFIFKVISQIQLSNWDRTHRFLLACISLRLRSVDWQMWHSSTLTT